MGRGLQQDRADRQDEHRECDHDNVHSLSQKLRKAVVARHSKITCVSHVPRHAPGLRLVPIRSAHVPARCGIVQYVQAIDLFGVPDRIKVRTPILLK